MEPELCSGLDVRSDADVDASHISEDTVPGDALASKLSGAIGRAVCAAMAESQQRARDVQAHDGSTCGAGTAYPAAVSLVSRRKELRARMLLRGRVPGSRGRQNVTDDVVMMMWKIAKNRWQMTIQHACPALQRFHNSHSVL